MHTIVESICRMKHAYDFRFGSILVTEVPDCLSVRARALSFLCVNLGAHIIGRTRLFRI